MSISSTLYTALTGLSLSQTAMEVTSHNMANVNTPGYSRQRLNLAALAAQNRSWGVMGLGVTANNITRYHDEYLTRSLIAKTAALGRYEAEKKAADVLQAYFNETYGNGLNQALSSFWAGWERVADSPTLNPPREELISRAETLAAQIRLRRRDMDSCREDLNQRLAEAAGAVNDILKELARLNDQVMQSELPQRNQRANDLRDTREELLRQLADLVEIDYHEDPQNGTLNVTTPKGVQLVLGAEHYVLKADRGGAGGDVRLTWVSPKNERVELADGLCGGRVGGWIHFRDQVMPDFYLQLDSLADNLIFQINNQHAQGAGLAWYTESYSTTHVYNRPAYDVPFPGDDNDLRLTALVPWAQQAGGYDPQKDPENIAVRFEKSAQVSSEITSSVVWNGAPGVQKWEITIVLPVDSNGNVRVTSRQVAEYINSERSGTPFTGVDQLPPLVPWPAKVGDFIQASPSKNNNGQTAPNIYGLSNPPGGGTFYTLNRELRHMLPQGDHLSYGFEAAQLTTTLPHTNNDLVFKALEAGAAGETISVEYVAAGPGSPLSVAVTAGPNGESHIVVNLATDAAGQVITKAKDIAAAINNHPAARLLVSAETAPGQDGLGEVQPMDRTYLDRSGFFNLVVYGQDGQASFHRVTVRPTDTLDDVARQIGDTFENGLPGLRVEVLTDERGRNYLHLFADAENGLSYGFANDSSGALAALGLNNLFTGSDSSDMGLNQALVNNRLFLASGLINADGALAAGDNGNALALADIKNLEYQFHHLVGTMGEAFNGLYGDLGAANQALTREYDFTAYLVGQIADQRDMVAGVNIDEEVAEIMRFQYMYQAAAKMVAVVDEMMAALLAMR